MAPEALAIIVVTVIVVACAIGVCWALDRRGQPDEPFSREDDFGDRP
jgi:hypothetical protein